MDNARICKLVRLRARLAVFPKNKLNSVVLFHSNHWFVVAAINLFSPLKHPCIKDIGEYPVGNTFCKRTAASPLHFWSPKTPFPVGYLHYLGRGIVPRKHQVPHFAYQMKTLWVLNNGVL
ncbi:MAG: hypothetical protein A3D67_01535 [Candidatus Lloydbacteria bacterium RIFCSPHIGHO2_02_FULL_51_22]|uniref:Uncharacterized protein n=1 Tax=Candidatus Lloydbacteria bacterium RIFCSPHIGHO2_02_FULL_51_22 TaxID=1798663 RepID=A0A1G2D5V2_9BACT|nr:MAG: hypothetical protein A3D67_01535 [Candidatus Lloydbacteria bacterium RIFCSPHIGHO2_02_FULL_51_22]